MHGNSNIKKILAIYSEDHTKKPKTQCGQIEKFVTLKQVGMYSNHFVLMARNSLFTILTFAPFLSTNVFLLRMLL